MEIHVTETDLSILQKTVHCEIEGLAIVDFFSDLREVRTVLESIKREGRFVVLSDGRTIDVNELTVEFFFQVVELHDSTKQREDRLYSGTYNISIVEALN